LDTHASIFVAGTDTLIGSAIARKLQQHGYTNILNLRVREPDLTDAKQVGEFFALYQPQFVFLAAGKSGGILANQQYPATLMLNNLLTECQIIHHAYLYKTQKLLYLASSCSYPKHSPQPMQVESLLTGPLEPTNEAYAIAKLSGIKLCQAYNQEHGSNFISAIPANAFGIEDDFSLENSHVIPALIRKFHQAKVDNQEFVEIWGTGSPRREFIFADDLADACIFLMAKYNESKPINLGGGKDVSIKDLAILIKDIVGYEGQLRFDTNKPDGMPLKALESSLLQSLGWQPKTSLPNAITLTYEWWLQHLYG